MASSGVRRDRSLGKGRGWYAGRVVLRKRGGGRGGGAFMVSVIVGAGLGTILQLMASELFEMML
jgi:hypothetical protein